ncbi:MAG: hypothetical protein EZS26_002621 [Candidatus Ordinivivax streblomastigis]|uniref:Fibronectin type-III domain-containing protein n=1 Tax=Candidatus Ordinivivax streblomastigis TaxID=2540710 RepID=A0A5M8NWK2_9BACT|nr:MAG: hypothetical protein EZS26_002621 [Candidatus Ordinivivax streblomastigis]
MKVNYFKKMTLAAAALSLGMGISAQSVSSFSLYASQNPGSPGLIPGTHRTRAAVGDFNNDGYIDLYYGGQDPSEEAGTGWNCLSNLIKNNGNGTFTRINMEESGLPINSKSNFLFLDYNNDGNLDLLLTGDAEYGLDVPRYTYLYKNLGPAGGYKFEQVLESGLLSSGTPTEDYGKAFSAGDYDKDGFIDILITGEKPDLGWDQCRYVELYHNNGNGTFTKQDGPAKASSGACAFGDLNNDGWLDIFQVGYPSDSGEEGQSKWLHIFRNNTDGTFTDVTNSAIHSYGTFDSESILSDINGDGLLDIVAIGYSTSYNRIAAILINEGDFNFRYVDGITLGLATAGRTTVVAADLNNDGIMDLAYAGRDDHDNDKHKTWIFYQGASGSFALEPSISLPYFETTSGGLNLGDFNGDNAIDIVLTAYNETPDLYGCRAEIYVNTLGDEVAANTPPTTPTNLQASITDGQLNVTWNAATDDHTAAAALAYNVYVQSADGTFMLIPADIASGRLKTITDISVATRRLDYSMPLTDGDYTIGVQAIDQSAAAGRFATVSTGPGTAINTPNVKNVVVITGDGGFYVQANTATKVTVSDLYGRTIAIGLTNGLLPVGVHGVYLITVDGKTYKAVK